MLQILCILRRFFQQIAPLELKHPKQKRKTIENITSHQIQQVGVIQCTKHTKHEYQFCPTLELYSVM